MCKTRRKINTFSLENFNIQKTLHTHKEGQWQKHISISTFSLGDLNFPTAVKGFRLIGVTCIVVSYLSRMWLSLADFHQNVVY